VPESATPQPLLRPLLDRLTDHQRKIETENPDSQTLSRKELRQAVIKDLAWLLDTTRLAVSVDLGEWPEVERSVLNFGLPSFTGETASSLDVQKLEKAIKEAILRFEPRIVARSLKVSAESTDSMLDWHNVVRVRISAQVWAQPVPLEILLRTEVNLETGQVALQDLSG